MAGVGGWDNKRQVPALRQVCRDCGKEDEQTSFPCQRRRDGSLYYRPYCWSCKYAKHDKGKSQSQRVKEYQKSYARANKIDLRYKAYVTHDRKRLGERGILSKDQALEMMRLPCFYCDASPSHGLDRVDNSLGHVDGNVRPCCEKCNLIMGDIPDAAKLCLISGLTKIQQQGFLEGWEIPTKRRKA